MSRIAIIGGGPGGLMAAYLLERKGGQQNEITLFEASERIGGKIVSRRFDAAPVLYEAGVAELYDYSHIGHDPLRELVDKLELPTVWMAGKTVILGKRIMTRRADIKRHFGKKTLKAIERFRERGRALISPQDYYDAGWPDDNNHVWANRSFQSVLAKVPDAAARRFLHVSVSSDLAIEPHLTSGLYGIENCLMDVPGYLRLYSIKDGIERLPKALRRKISARVELNRPVVSVKKNPDESYRVTYRKGGEIDSEDFEAVAVALPNGWLPTIEWRGERLEAAMANHHSYYYSPAHYLRVAVLFKRPFWRHLITDSYFHVDAFGGCCVYDECSRYDVGPYGVLSWLLGGNHAMIMANHDDRTLIAKVLASLPEPLAEGRRLFIEAKVHRWIGSVSGRPGGFPIKGPRARHLPDADEHPGLFVIGDYLFDSTINGALDSAEIATDMLLSYVKKQEASIGRSSRAAG
jgi:protoporphyrinogen oxidase